MFILEHLNVKIHFNYHINVICHLNVSKLLNVLIVFLNLNDVIVINCFTLPILLYLNVEIFIALISNID